MNLTPRAQVYRTRKAARVRIVEWCDGNNIHIWLSMLIAAWEWGFWGILVVLVLIVPVYVLGAVISCWVSNWRFICRVRREYRVTPYPAPKERP